MASPLGEAREQMTVWTTATRLLKGALKHADLALTRHSTLQTLYERSSRLEANSRALQDQAFLAHMPEEHIAPLFRLLGRSRSQIRQDLFVLSALDFKRDGFFVEFGATNGVDLSNTWLLEQDFGWTGILAEPARCWHEALMRNRSCRIDHRCVWARSGESLTFEEGENADMSTIQRFSGADHHARNRRVARCYDVPTVSLTDLLLEHNAPAEMDFLSIDTEGSEFDILSAFDHERFRFRVIVCEHNHSPKRDKLKALLESYGYRRTLEAVSQFDDWYLPA
jgi:FkbM family methyltransferase